MKRKIALIAVIAMLGALAAAGTLAYFTDNAQAHNVITSGGVNIELIEHTTGDTGLVEFPENGLTGIMPGTSASKIVQVKNLQEKAWIRVWVSAGISEPGDPITNPTIKNLPLEIEVNGEMKPVITYDFNTEDWIQGEDGYWYYKQPVEKDAETNALFREVHFAEEMTNEYQGCKVLIDVTAEAVQYANNNNNMTAIETVEDLANIDSWTE